MPTISRLHARQILDSRGNPTVEVDCILDDGAIGRAAVPSGSSTGSHEAVELRDNDKMIFGGKSVLKAVKNVNTVIAKAMVGEDIISQRYIDERLTELDGTPNKAKLGANAILGASMACCRARAMSNKESLYASLAEQFDQAPPSKLPVPQCNIINGGAHTSWESTDIQEFMIMPVGAASFREGLRTAAEIFHMLKKVLEAQGYGTTVGDEGGFAPRLKHGNEEALSLIAEAVTKAGYHLGKDVVLALDVASSEFHEDGTYKLRLEGKEYSSQEMIVWYRELQKRYPIASIEDGLSEGDWDGWKTLNTEMGASAQLVGDDLLVTNVKFLERAIAENAANAILIKLNQIGTVTETADAILMARAAGWNSIVSHRSGETEDTFIAHLAVALGTGQIKTGSLSRTDRICKYNELLRIEEELATNARYQSPF